jgi:hypothetical protein
MSVNPTPHDLPDDRRIGVSWWTVGVFAAVLAAADGFWATSVRGAVGYIENVQEPFHDWLLYLAVMGPLFAAVVAGTLWLANRLVGRRRAVVRIIVASVLVVVATTVVALAQISATAAYDYQRQQAQVALMHHIHSGSTAGTGVTYRLDPGVTIPAQPKCTGLCDEKAQTIAVHYKAIRLATLLLLVTNLVLVLWALALRGGRLWVRRRAIATAPDTDPRATVGLV